jgi:predicted acylesterase/phospholipase RssA
MAMKDEIQPGRTFVVATCLHAGGAVRMRSYGIRDADPFAACIWEVARATMAAPTSLLPIEIDGILYGDGSLGFNNPTKEAIEEAHSIWPDRPIGILVSVGSGLEKSLQLRDLTKTKGVPSKALKPLVMHTAVGYAYRSQAVAKYALECLMSCELIHREVAERSAREVLQDNYFRLNVSEEAIAAIGLADWDKSHELKALTSQYMDHPDQRKTNHKIAQLLLSPEGANSSMIPHLTLKTIAN